MALSTCIKCGNNTFVLVENTPSGSDYKLSFVQCSKCGGVVGVLDYYSASELILRLAEKLNLPLDK